MKHSALKTTQPTARSILLRQDVDRSHQTGENSMDDDKSALPKESERYGLHASDIIDRILAKIANGNTEMISSKLREDYEDRVHETGRSVEDLLVEDLKKFRLRIAI